MQVSANSSACTLIIVVDTTLPPSVDASYLAVQVNNTITSIKHALNVLAAHTSHSTVRTFQFALLTVDTSVTGASSCVETAVPLKELNLKTAHIELSKIATRASVRAELKTSQAASAPNSVSSYNSLALELALGACSNMLTQQKRREASALESALKKASQEKSTTIALFSHSESQLFTQCANSDKCNEYLEVRW